MSNVTKKLKFGSTDYMVGNNIIELNVSVTAGQDWSVNNTISASLTSAVDFSNPDQPAAITDYAALFTELKGGRPVYIAVRADGDTTYCSATPYIPGPGAPCLISINDGLLFKSSTSTYRAFGCNITLTSTGTATVTMRSLGESVDVPASVSLKPIIIKTAAISGDPAVNDVITLTASEIYDTAKGSTVAAANLFAKGTAGRRLVVYIQGAGLTLVTCELLPVYNTDYTTPVLFSGFTGIKFRGANSNNYYGIYVKLESDGTLKAIIEDKQVYNS